MATAATAATTLVASDHGGGDKLAAVATKVSILFFRHSRCGREGLAATFAAARLAILHTVINLSRATEIRGLLRQLHSPMSRLIASRPRGTPTPHEEQVAAIPSSCRALRLRHIVVLSPK